METPDKSPSNNSQLQYTPLTLEQMEELKENRKKYFNHLCMTDDQNTTINYLTKLYPETNSIEQLIDQVDDLKKCLDSFRPLDVAQLRNLEEHLATSYTYESNRIEGNTLTLRETHLVLNEGLTIGGKPIKDHLEAINHLKAYN